MSRSSERAPRSVSVVAGVVGIATIAATLAMSLVFGAAARARTDAAPVRAPVEIWGVSATDHVEIDGAAVPPRGAQPRAFAGDPTAMNAPILRELAEGSHEIVIEREGCVARRFSIEVKGTLKRSIVMAPLDAALCAVPVVPPRADAR